MRAIIKSFLFSTVALITVGAQSASAQPELVKDINLTDSGSHPNNIVRSGGYVYYSAEDSTHGRELWRSDGTVAGTILVKDIVPGSGGSHPQSLVDVNGTVFFRAYQPSTGYELWKSDGTAAGTVLVKDIYPGSGYTWLDYLTNVNGVLFFRGNDGSGDELWKSDGTTAGTVVVKDIVAGSGGSNPHSLVNVNGVLFFRAFESTTGYELWKSDGTSAGTVLVKDVYPGPSSSTLDYLTSVGGKLLFRAYDASTGYGLWASDGTTAGTVLVKDLSPDLNYGWLHNLTDVNGIAYFVVYDGWTYDLWKSDGTTAGTVVVRDSSSLNWWYGDYLTNVNGTLLFRGQDSTGVGLWKSDGTSAGTVRISGSGADATDPYFLINLNGTLFFRGYNPSIGHELWKSDGTAGGTVIVKDIVEGADSSYVDGLTVAAGKLFFAADDRVNGRELWTSTGTEAGTTLVANVSDRTEGANPQWLTWVDGTLFFSAFEPATGWELYKSNGTAGGTTRLKDIAPGFASSDPGDLTNVNGVLFFRAYSPSTGGHDLWKSDGTEAGTVLVKDLNPGGYSHLYQLTKVGSTLFFSGYDGTSGYHLWKSDGTTAGTTVVSTDDNDPYYLTDVNGTLFFRAWRSDTGYELWKSNGTAAGTVLVKEIGSSTDSSWPEYLTNVNGTLYFRAYQPATGYELWKSDGTAAGTVLVTEIVAGAGSSSIEELTNVNGTLYFRAYHPSYGWELWKSDGTAAGTALVKEIHAGTAYSYPHQLTNVGGTLFFVAYQSATGYELWKSDGTVAGTVMVTEITPGVASGGIGNLKNVNGTLFFTAFEPTTGWELWKSDGTDGGTVLVADIWNGTNGSSPSWLTAAGDTLYFSANDYAHGHELWRFGAPANTAPVANAGADKSIEATGASTPVTLDGSASSDLDNDVLTFQWRDSANAVVGNAPLLSLSLPLGTHTFTLLVDDGNGGTATDTVAITIVDTTDPTIHISAPTSGPYALNASVLAGYTCSDYASAVISCTGTVAVGAAVDTSAAGSFSFVVTATDAVGNSSTATVSYTVNKGTPVITWNTPASVGYGTALTGTQLNASSSVPGTFTYSPGQGTVLSAGSHVLSVSFTPADGTNYDPVPLTTVTLSVLKANLTITADNKSKVYGAALPEWSASYSGFVNGDTPASLDTPVALATTATAGSSVGTYPITPSGAADLNYTIAFVDGTLTVTHASLIVTADNKSKVYGAAMPAMSATYSGFVNGDTPASLDTPIAFTTTATAASNVGTFPITPSGAADANYAITFVGGTLTVNPASLTITADNKSRTYGADNPVLTASFSGFVNGDNESALDTPVALSTTAVKGSSVGDYPITAGAAVDANYTIVFVSGTLNVIRAPLTIRADDKTRAYGTANPELTATYTGFVNSDTAAALDTAVSLATSADSNSGAGSYDINASGASDGNYAIEFVTGTLTVTRAALTVTAQDASRTYGASNPAFAATYSGFVNGDDQGDLTGVLAFSTTATPASNVGAYPVTPGGLASGNYTIAFVAGTLTVTPAPLSVGVQNVARLYGQANPAFTPAFSGFVNGQGAGVLGGVLSFATAAIQASPVGSYPVTPSGLTSSNYAIVFVAGALTINPAPLTIRADDQTMLLNGTLPALTASYAGFMNTDTSASLLPLPSVTTTATGTTPGSFPISVAGAVNPNYAISYVPGTLQVLYAPADSVCLGQPGHTVLQPIDPTGSVFKKGSTVPVKFRVCDAAGQSVAATVVKTFALVQVVAGTEVQAVTEEIISTTPDTTFRWDPTGQQWIFNLSTKNLTLNRTYYYRITLMDNTTIDFRFGVR